MPVGKLKKVHCEICHKMIDPRGMPGHTRVHKKVLRAGPGAEAILQQAKSDPADRFFLICADGEHALYERTKAGKFQRHAFHTFEV